MTARLLYVGTFLEPPANVSYCTELADRLEAQGIEVTRSSSRWNRMQRIADMLATTWSRRASYDVAIVDVFSGPAFLWAEATCFVLRRLGKPYVLTLHGGRLPEFAKQWPRRVQRLLASASRVTAPSRYMYEAMRPYRDDIILVRNAVDTRAVAANVRDRARARLVWVRAFDELYNPTLAVEAVARAARKIPELTLAMIGPDKGSLDEVTRRARELGVSERIEIVGRVPKSEIPQHLARADIFINTTNVDNTPISVLEALSAGLCVISTAVGGIPYLLEHERTALLVPPNDADAMSVAIERVVVDPALAARLSREGRSIALEHDWAPVLAQWQQLLGEVARG
jgi:glycosyltransferase involved in cell wall biosynthesis